MTIATRYRLKYDMVLHNQEHYTSTPRCVVYGLPDDGTTELASRAYNIHGVEALHVTRDKGLLTGYLDKRLPKGAHVVVKKGLEGGFHDNDEIVVIVANSNEEIITAQWALEQY